MASWYVDLESGNDSNAGTSWGAAKLTPKGIPVASLANGDEIRVAKSADPLLVDDATWTDGSATVTLAAPSASLTTQHFASRTSEPYWGSWPWHAIVSVSGVTVTLKRKYRGPSGTFPLYARMPARPAPTTGVLLGFGATGGTSVTTDLVMSGGWNPASGIRDGQTFIDGQTGQGCHLRVTALGTVRVDVSHFSFARFNTQSLSGYVSPTGTCEIDNVVDCSGQGFCYGSGNNGQHGTCRINAICGNGGASSAGLHVHTAWANTIDVGKLLDNGINLTQNNDFTWHVGNTYRIGEAAYSTWGFGGGSAYFNFCIEHDISIDSVHDNTLGGVGVEADGPNTFRIASAYNNPVDLDFSSSPVYDPAWVQTLEACGLGSPTPILNPTGLPLVIRRLVATAGAVYGGRVPISIRRVAGSLITVTRR